MKQGEATRKGPADQKVEPAQPRFPPALSPTSAMPKATTPPTLGFHPALPQHEPRQRIQSLRAERRCPGLGR